MGSHKTIEKLYYKLPVFLQDVVVSVKGWQLEWARRRGIYNACKLQIMQRSNWGREQFNAYQDERLRELLRFAVREVPYYKRILADRVEDDVVCSGLASLPLLPREVVKNNQDQFVARKGKSGVVLQTTGTTGSPLTVVSDIEARRRNYAFFDAYLETLGLDPSRKHIVIGGRVVVPPEQAGPPFWRVSRFQNSLLMSSYHISEESSSAYVDEIERYSPDYIESYPSSIYLIARHMCRVGRRVKVRAVITSSETLFRDQREVIEDAFQCSVYDQYGCVEMALFVGQCVSGKYHVRPDYGCLELVDDAGAPVAPGEVGNVVCTGFVNYRMPLIRYVLGDRAIMDPDQDCACGLRTPILSEIQGRMDDLLVTADGRYIGRMSPVLKGLPVKEAQYIQTVPGELLVKVVPDAAFDEGRDIDAITNAIRLRVGDAMRIDIRLVTELERGKGGKLRSVISSAVSRQDVLV